MFVFSFPTVDHQLTWLAPQSVPAKPLIHSRPGNLSQDTVHIHTWSEKTFINVNFLLEQIFKNIIQVSSNLIELEGISSQYKSGSQLSLRLYSLHNKFRKQFI